MKIGIIGAGNVGAALAEHFHKLQHTVLIANSRGPETLSQVAKETGATPVAISEVAKGVDLLVIAIPMNSVLSLRRDLLRELPSRSPIIDTGNYIPQFNGVITEIEGGLTESEWTSRALGRPTVKAFNNIMALSLIHGGLPKGSKSRIALPISGEDIEAKRLVSGLLNNMGFDALDAGPLTESWRQQPGTPAYASDPTLKELTILLEKADRKKSAGKRDQAMKLMAKLPADFPPQVLVQVSRLSAGLDTLKAKSWVAIFRLGLALLRPARS